MIGEAVKRSLWSSPPVVFWIGKAVSHATPFRLRSGEVTWRRAGARAVHAAESSATERSAAKHSTEHAWSPSQTAKHGGCGLLVVIVLLRFRRLVPRRLGRVSGLGSFSGLGRIRRFGLVGWLGRIRWLGLVGNHQCLHSRSRHGGFRHGGVGDHSFRADNLIRRGNCRSSFNDRRRFLPIADPGSEQAQTQPEHTSGQTRNGGTMTCETQHDLVFLET